GNHYDDNILRIEKFRPGHVWTAVLFDADQGYPYIKRFAFEPSARKQRYLGENQDSRLILLTDTPGARFEVTFGGSDSFREAMTVDAAEFIGTKSFKAKGKRLTTFELGEVREIEPNAVAAEAEAAAAGNAEAVEPEEDAVEIEEKSDEDVRDEINGQTHLFDSL
ncbi:MAG: DNA gyrase/topoisomerase IV subunit A, partial [Muribaculaceae bacterium]|nr:DNA gyrase/topoisomerase IV subunit A [Muribaculaceae bacterium]